jgi:hypothetical protein
MDFSNTNSFPNASDSKKLVIVKMQVIVKNYYAKFKQLLDSIFMY